MLKLTRKQRELRQRESLILDVTRDLFLDRGYHGLTMDRIGEALEYSKGTIYQHFPCKEDALTELAIRILQTRQAMFERAATFQGRTRERMVAIGEAGELFARLYPEDLRALQTIKAEIIFRKVSEERLARMPAAEFRVLNNLMVGIVRDALAQGDLVLPARSTPEEPVFGLWAITEGGYGTIVRGIPFYEIGIQDPYSSVIHCCEILGDGYGWRPLTAEWDYAETRARIHATVFPEETRRLQSMMNKAAAKAK